MNERHKALLLLPSVARKFRRRCEGAHCESPLRSCVTRRIRATLVVEGTTRVGPESAHQRPDVPGSERRQRHARGCDVSHICLAGIPRVSGHLVGKRILHAPKAAQSSLCGRIVDLPLGIRSGIDHGSDTASLSFPRGAITHHANQYAAAATAPGSLTTSRTLANAPGQHTRTSSCDGW